MDHLSAMLADSAPLERLTSFVNDDNWMLQQKVDGHRCLVHVEPGKVAPISRNGLDYPLHPQIVRAFERFSEQVTNRWVFDGEYLDGIYWVFDLPEAEHLVTTDDGAMFRWTVLQGIISRWANPLVPLLPTYLNAETKGAAAANVLAASGEGVMVKHKDGKYYPGKRSDQCLKVKYRHDIDCVVTELGRGGKANMVLALVDDSELVEVGECSALTGDGPRIQVGDVVTVIYQYATTTKRKLFHPTLPRIRSDKSPAECGVDQLVFVNKTVLV